MQRGRYIVDVLQHEVVINLEKDIQESKEMLELTIGNRIIKGAYSERLRISDELSDDIGGWYIVNKKWKEVADNLYKALEVQPTYKNGGWKTGIRNDAIKGYKELCKQIKE